MFKLKKYWFSINKWKILKLIQDFKSIYCENLPSKESTRDIKTNGIKRFHEFNRQNNSIQFSFYLHIYLN